MWLHSMHVKVVRVRPPKRSIITLWCVCCSWTHSVIACSWVKLFTRTFYLKGLFLVSFACLLILFKSSLKVSKKRLRNSWQSCCSLPVNAGKCFIVTFLKASGLRGAFFLTESKSWTSKANSSATLPLLPWGFCLFKSRLKIPFKK